MSHTNDSVDALFLFVCRTLWQRERDRRARTMLLLGSRMNSPIAFLARHFLREIWTRPAERRLPVSTGASRLTAAEATPDCCSYAYNNSTKENL
jgi:hypothetical protein